MNKLLLGCGVLVCTLAMNARSVEPAPAPATKPIAPAPAPDPEPEVEIDPKMEMFPIDELDSWKRVAEKDPAAVMAPALKAWEKQRPAVEKELTPEMVQQLSKWAQAQMEGYQKVPPLDKLKFELAGQSPDGKQILLETTVDTLPTHSKLVTRWLKLYLICDKSTGQIFRVIVTIRGELQE